jgi:hypothetical protein
LPLNDLPLPEGFRLSTFGDETMFNDYCDFNISGHFLSALINDDYSGLTDEEAMQLDQFVDQWQHLSGTFDVLPTGTDFKTCDISNAFSEVYDVRLYFHNDKLPAGITFDAFAD